MRANHLYLLLSILIVAFFYANVIDAKAMNTGFSTEELSDEDKTTFVNNNNISLMKTAPEKSGILQFDVNEQGMIAICQEHSEKEEICIYNVEGEYLYGYSIKTHGSICVEWDQENINILFVRGETLVSVDCDGDVLDVKKVPSTVNNTIYQNSLHSTRRTIGDTEYQIRNDHGVILNFLTVSFSQIVVTNADGVERIIYDVNTDQLIRKIAVLILISALVTITIVVIVREFKKLQQKK